VHITIDPERFKKLKVWILVPAAGDKIHATFSACLIKLLGTLRQNGVWYELRYLPGDSLVTRARNNLADIFMTDSTDPDDYSLWLDCDVLFNPENVIQMLALNMDFLAAPYTRKGLHGDRIAEAARLNWTNERMFAVAGSPNVNWIANPVKIDEPFPVLEAGSGFWLVKRKVFEQLRDSGAAPRYKRTPDETSHYGREYAHDYFRVGVWPETEEYLSEDWWFCREWRNLGGTLFCCFWIKTTHVGQYMFPMDMPAIADLLSATGGYINGPTREDKNATAHLRTAGSNGNDHGNSDGDGGDQREAAEAAV